MKVWKKCKVVTISVNIPARITLAGNSLMLAPHQSTKWHVTPNNINKYLYIVSKDDIQVGDWYIINSIAGVPSIYQCVKRDKDRVYYGSITSDDIEQCSKIIAMSEKDPMIEVPSISDSFLQAYCNNPHDSEVLVHYGLDTNRKDVVLEFAGISHLGKDPVLDKNGNIIIQLPDKCWNNKQIEEVAESFFWLGRATGQALLTKGQATTEFRNKLKELYEGKFNNS